MTVSIMLHAMIFVCGPSTLCFIKHGDLAANVGHAQLSLTRQISRQSVCPKSDGHWTVLKCIQPVALDSNRSALVALATSTCALNFAHLLVAVCDGNQYCGHLRADIHVDSSTEDALCILEMEYAAHNSPGDSGIHWNKY